MRCPAKFYQTPYSALTPTRGTSCTRGTSSTDNAGGPPVRLRQLGASFTRNLAVRAEEPPGLARTQLEDQLDVCVTVERESIES